MREPSAAILSSTTTCVSHYSSWTIILSYKLFFKKLCYIICIVFNLRLQQPLFSAHSSFFRPILFIKSHDLPPTVSLSAYTKQADLHRVSAEPSVFGCWMGRAQTGFAICVSKRTGWTVKCSSVAFDVREPRLPPNFWKYWSYGRKFHERVQIHLSIRCCGIKPASWAGDESDASNLLVRNIDPGAWNSWLLRREYFSLSLWWTCNFFVHLSRQYPDYYCSTALVVERTQGQSLDFRELRLNAKCCFSFTSCISLI